MENSKNVIVEKVRECMNSTPNGVSFFGIQNYTNRYGEKSNFLINIGGSYANAKKKDVDYLSGLDVATIDSDISNELLEEARVALLESLINPNERKSSGQKDAYTILNNAVKVHNDNGALYIYGTSIDKEVIVEGAYPTVNSRPLTIAKRVIQKNMRSAKYKMFKIEAQPENITLSGASETMIIKMVE